jgi:hypothetical protein
MKFEEKRVGDYCIYTGAVEALSGDGFMAAVVVQRDMPGRRPPQEVFRDERMSGGHRWPSAREALNFAMHRGLEAIRDHSRPAVDAGANTGLNSHATAPGIVALNPRMPAPAARPVPTNGLPRQDAAAPVRLA